MKIRKQRTSREDNVSKAWEGLYKPSCPDSGGEPEYSESNPEPKSNRSAARTGRTFYVKVGRSGKVRAAISLSLIKEVGLSTEELVAMGYRKARVSGEDKLLDCFAELCSDEGEGGDVKVKQKENPYFFTIVEHWFGRL